MSAIPEARVVVLCGGAPRHVYVANRLCQSLNVVAVIKEVGRRVTPGKIMSLLRPPVAARKIGRWLRDRQRYAGNREATFFFEGAVVKAARPDLVQCVAYINDEVVAETVRGLRPDFVAVFGTSIIKPPLLGLGGSRMLNLHGGLSPDYRGADCTFWAMFNGEPERIGCTLHFISHGIDTGPLVAHVCPEVKDGDDELTLFWRGVRSAADIYVDAIARLDHGELLGQPQATRGKLYQVKDRTWAIEREFARRIPGGVMRGIDLPSRITWFESPAAQQVEAVTLNES